MTISRSVRSSAADWTSFFVDQHPTAHFRRTPGVDGHVDATGKRFCPRPKLWFGPRKQGRECDKTGPNCQRQPGEKSQHSRVRETHQPPMFWCVSRTLRSLSRLLRNRVVWADWRVCGDCGDCGATIAVAAHQSAREATTHVGAKVFRLPPAANDDEGLGGRHVHLRSAPSGQGVDRFDRSGVRKISHLALETTQRLKFLVEIARDVDRLVG